MRNMARRLLITAGFAVVFGLTAPHAWASGCDLYTLSSSCAFNGGVFNVVGPQPTGTGTINSFLRVQQKGAEEGFNTGFRPMACDGRTCDDKTDPNYTRNLLSSAVPTQNGFRQFFLDINEPGTVTGNQNLLTLDKLEVYVSNSPDLNTHTTGVPDSLTGATQVYDMETGNTDNWVNLDYNLVGGGSGKGDMVLFVPDSPLFTSNSYVYLYSEFGCGATFTASMSCGNGANTKYQSQAGFEEWWVASANNTTTTPGVPEPATLLLCGTGLMLARRYRRRLV
jgi:hypothetical protein